MLNGANSQMLHIITGRTAHEEVTTSKCTFDLVRWIRSRRLQWVGHILRMKPDRKIKQAVYDMFRDPTSGDLLMDAPKTTSWRELCTRGCDREGWSKLVRELRQDPIHKPPAHTTTHQHTITTTTQTVTTSKTVTATAASTYRARDNKTMLLYPKLRQSVPKKKKKKQKPRSLTNKQRQTFALQHYKQHHEYNECNDDITFSPQPILT